MVKERKITITGMSTLIVAQIKKRIEEKLCAEHACYLAQNFASNSILLILHCKAEETDKIFNELTAIALEYNLLNQLFITAHDLVYTCENPNVIAFYREKAKAN